MYIRNEYMNRLSKYRNLENKLNQQSAKISKARLAVFILTLTITIWCYSKEMGLMAMVTLVSGLLIFILLIRKHENVKYQIKKASCKQTVNKRYIERIDGNYGDFEDSGEAFKNENHPYTKDLDIFGKNSLFQWINVSRTYYGRIRLRDLLCNPSKEIKIMKARQSAVKEMAGLIEFTESLQCELLMNEKIGKNSEPMLLSAEDAARIFKNKNMRYIFYILPIVTILCISLGYINMMPTTIGFIFLILQTALFGFGSIKTSKLLSSVYGFKKELVSYRNILDLIEKHEFEDQYLNECKLRLKMDKKMATDYMKELVKIAEAIDVRHNAWAYFILNGAFLWDYHCVYALEEWKDKCGVRIRTWIEVAAEFEAVASLAVVAQINDKWTYPEFENHHVIFTAKNIGHPLIGTDKCVCNDINVHNNYCVITGSNMSGKTTLLRTIGINLVLAYAGAPVYAQALKCSVMSIFTSMRIEDDLNNGISTFYAELLRIKEIIDYSKQQIPMIYLIDEIFKGTNSNDRSIGAKNVIKNLNKPWVIGLISTHDLELCDIKITGNRKIENYHFTEKYRNGQIQFDYKLKSGRSNTTNAKYLMEMVGINLD
ncbi:MAG: DNA mismatch repair protein MutS [Clostridia bacterium]|nr:DNA mismatch repair protein MutS [Clostridia bacterium]